MSEASEPEILHDVTAMGGRYLIHLEGGEDAVMTYRNMSEDVIIIDHTYVPRSARGKGLAEALVNRGIADARATGRRIVPQCSYVAAQFKRHPEWADLMAG